MTLATIAAMSQPSNREIVEAFVRAIEAKDIDAQCALMADDFVDEMPQSGERIRGRENWRKVFEGYPGGIGTASPEGRRIIGSEDRWGHNPDVPFASNRGLGDIYTYVGTVRYADGGVWQFIVIAQLRNGKSHGRRAGTRHPCALRGARLARRIRRAVSRAGVKGLRLAPAGRSGSGCRRCRRRRRSSPGPSRSAPG